MDNRYDVIVIGSGLGGLAAATALAKGGMRVKVFEKHSQPGGYATTFFRDRFEFEVSLHALSGIGTPEQPGPLLKQLRHLNVAQKVEFIPFKDLYRSIGEGVDVTVPKGVKEALDTLVAAFPHEARGITHMMQLVQTIAYEVDLVRAKNYSTAPLATLARLPNVAHAAGIPVSRVLDREISDPAARLAFAQLWGYFGLPPSRLSMLMFGVGFNTYLRYGAAGIRGKSQSLSNAFVDTLSEYGGESVCNNGISRILVENGRVCGVETDAGERVEADIVVANANPMAVLGQMIDPQHIPAGTRKYVDEMQKSLGTVSLYLGLDRPSADIGINDYEVYLNRHVDMDAQYDSCLRLENPGVVAMCAYDVINPAAAPDGAGVVVITTLSDGRAWESLSPEGYRNARDSMAEHMLRQADAQYPGLSRHIETATVATPITNMRYTGNPEGAIYGYANTPEQNPGFRLANKGPIPGLWFASAWTQPGGGFQTTMTSGFNTALAILSEKKEKVSTQVLLKAADLYVPVLPLETKLRVPRGWLNILKDGPIVRRTIASKYAKHEAPPDYISPAAVGRTVDHFHATFRRVNLIDRFRCGEDATTLRLKAEEGILPPFYAGQYFNLFVTINGISVSRPYSASSRPTEDGVIEFTVKDKRDGYVSEHLVNTIQLGDIVELTGPTGEFFINPVRDTDRIVGVAVGSGITPFISIIEDIKATGRQVSVKLFYGARREKDILFRERLGALAAENKWFTFVPVLSRPDDNWSGERGRVSGKILSSHLDDAEFSTTTFMVCGPRLLYDNMVEELSRRGVERRRIRLEPYGPPSDITAEDNWPESVSEGDEFLVSISGRSEPVRARAGVTLLDSLERAGFHRSALCRSGACDSCKVRLVSGDVFIARSMPGYETGSGGIRIQPCMCYPISHLSIAE